MSQADSGRFDERGESVGYVTRIADNPATIAEISDGGVLAIDVGGGCVADGEAAFAASGKAMES